MSKYVFIYHGGKKPESEQEGKEIMEVWGQWFGSLGSAVIDGGSAVGQSHTVNSDKSVSDNGGSNPTSGYSLIDAESLEDALEKAKGCPILTNGSGTVEVAETINM